METLQSYITSLLSPHRSKKVKRVETLQRYTISLQSLHTFDLFSTQPKYVFDFKELVTSYLVELFTKLFSRFGITFSRAIS